MDFASETPRTNYLNGGVVFGAAYGNGILTQAGTGVSDVTYSVAPTIALDQTRSQFHWNLSYSPGFTFYQKYSGLNQSSQNVATKFSYRFSPHVTFSASEGFTKTSGGYFPVCGSEPGSSCGALQSPNNSVIAPVTDTLNNASTAQITYQFSPGGMIGATGNFSKLSYPDQSQASGLFGSTAAGGSVFYTHRLSGKHYIGATYQYQKYVTNSEGASVLPVPATQAQSLMLFYTLYLQRTISFSLFGGPQYSDTSSVSLLGSQIFPEVRSWSPGGGGSVNWQGQHNSLGASYSRKVSDGGGLQGAVSYNGADASVRHQFTTTLSGTLGGDYSVNKLLDPAAALDNTGGHSISGTATVQRTFGEHFNLTAGYLRVHQSYDIPALQVVPNRDRVWLSIAYQFQRPLGR